jgi:hypothetical protein
MNAKLIEITQHRSSLVARSASQRERLSFYYQQFQTPATLIGRTFSIVKLLRSPLIATGLTFLLTRKRWKSIGRAPGLLMKGWQLFRTLSRLRS